MRAAARAIRRIASGRILLSLICVSATLYFSEQGRADWTGPTFPDGVGPSDSLDPLTEWNAGQLHQLEDNIYKLVNARLGLQSSRYYAYWKDDERCTSPAKKSLDSAVYLNSQPRPLYSDTEKDAFSAISKMAEVAYEMQDFYYYCIENIPGKPTCDECQVVGDRGCGKPWDQGYGICRTLMDVCKSCNPRAAVSEEVKDALRSLKASRVWHPGDPPPPGDIDYRNIHIDPGYLKQLKELAAPSIGDSFKFSTSGRP